MEAKRVPSPRESAPFRQFVCWRLALKVQAAEAGLERRVHCGRAGRPPINPNLFGGQTLFDRVLGVPDDVNGRAGVLPQRPNGGDEQLSLIDSEARAVLVDPLRPVALQLFDVLEAVMPMESPVPTLSDC